jgi:hypothetical protein
LMLTRHLPVTCKNRLRRNIAVKSRFHPPLRSSAMGDSQQTPNPRTCLETRNKLPVSRDLGCSLIARVVLTSGRYVYSHERPLSRRRPDPPEPRYYKTNPIPMFSKRTQFRPPGRVSRGTLRSH